MFSTLIDPAALAPHLADEKWAVLDCRFDLSEPDKGEALYLDGHIPGARYVHLDRDLSGEKTGTNGRHPLPTAEQMRERFGALGIGPGTQVVAYDADTGMYAARLWWMLRFMGHTAVAVLDGGLARWTREGHAVRGGREVVRPAAFVGAPREAWRLDTGAVLAHLADPESLLVDARAEPRFRGESEPLDKRAGHIPGACNFFFQQNLTDDKTFRSPDELRTAWRSLLNERPPDQVVMYCGSGVTACHNQLALEHAGLTGARIYPGSWSEWSSDPARPIETGPTASPPTPSNRG
jgi:thiosulfate/3-mercaptopyruvate sulfurtransferase